MKLFNLLKFTTKRTQIQTYLLVSEKLNSYFQSLVVSCVAEGDGQIKKQILAGLAVIVCVVLCAAVCPWSAKVGDLSAEPVKTVVPAKIESRLERRPQILFSADTPAPESEAVVESDPEVIEITAVKET